MARRIAVVDTGTNSTRLMVADLEGGELTEVVRHTEITRLGEGVQETGRLSPAAMDRVSRVFAGYRKITQYLEATETMLLATSSVRDAADGEDFIAGLAGGAAYDYRILTGQQEARLSFCGATLEQSPENSVVVVDVGGGSTELSAGKGSEPAYIASLDIGCVRLTEEYLDDDPPGADQLAGLAVAVDERLAVELDRNLLTGADVYLAVAGTVTTMAALHLGLVEYDRDAVHGHLLDRDTVRELLWQLAGMRLEERRGIEVMEAGRADVIVAGASIIDRLMDFLGAGEIQVSEKDILDGAAMMIGRGLL